jgi:hypothetical protein
MADLTSEQKATLGHATLKQFFDWLGPNDVYKQIVLEEFFKLLLEEEVDLSVLGGPGPDEHGPADPVPG